MTPSKKKLAIGAVLALVVLAAVFAFLEVARFKARKARALEVTAQGVSSLERGDHQAAIDAFGRALGIDPRSQMACLGLAEAMYGKGNVKGASTQFDACIALAESGGDPSELRVAQRARQAVLAK
jgi:Tfp pilus assembly protein PilF